MPIAVLDELLDLVLPANCVSCRVPGERWCPGCRPPPSARWVADQPNVATAAEYEGSVRSALLSYKERGNKRLAAPLGSLLAAAVEHVRAGRARPDQPVALVGVPPRRAVARQRGGDHVLRLAAVAGRQCGVPVLSVLRLRGSPRDSAGLTASERADNVVGRMTATPAPDVMRSRPGASLWRLTGESEPHLIIVDDIVTSGATLAEADRALRAAGWPVVACAVVAATRLRFAMRSRTNTGSHWGVTVSRPRQSDYPEESLPN